MHFYSNMMKSNKTLLQNLSLTLLGTALSTSLTAGEVVESKQVIIPEQEGWEFSLSPYFLMASLTGDVGINGVQQAVDASFDDLKDQLDAGAAGYFEARKGKWAIGVDALWIKLSGDGNIAPTPGTPLGGIDADLSIEEVRAKAALYYRFCETDSSSWDVYAGVTYNYVDVDLEASISGPGPGVSAGERITEGWFDPVVGLRFVHEFNDKWFMRALGEVGGGAESDFNWEAMALLGYHINQNWDVGLAYRGIGIDYEEDGFLYDVTLHGPMIGFSYNW
jgi:opacity protein-like surface antigen